MFVFSTAGIYLSAPWFRVRKPTLNTRTEIDPKSQREWQTRNGRSGYVSECGLSLNNVWTSCPLRPHLPAPRSLQLVGRWL